MSGPKVTVEVHFAQRLASNEKTIRDKTIKKLRLWMTVRSKSEKNVFTEEDFLKLWKGLFYCMWMCDKALVQEELADNIARLVHKSHTTHSALLFFKTFLQTMEREWHGIDRLRMDKYYMFIRRVFREQLEFLKEHQWNKEGLEAFLEVLKQGVLSASNPTKAMGLLHHISDIYLEELTRVGATQLSPQETLVFLDPFCALIARTKNKSLLKTLLRDIFEDIMVHSTVGMEDLLEEEKKMAKEQKNGNEDDEEENDDEEDPKLVFDYSAIADRLFQLGSHKETPGLNRKKIYDMAKKFQDLAEGIYPIPDLEEMAQLSSDDEIEDDDKLKHKRKQKKRMQEAKKKKISEKDDSEIVEDVNKVKRKRKSKERESSEAEIPLMNGEIKKKKKKKNKNDSLIDDESTTDIDGLITNKISKKLKKTKKEESMNVPTIDYSKVEVIDIDTKKKNEGLKLKNSDNSNKIQKLNQDESLLKKSLDFKNLPNGNKNKKKTKKGDKRKSETHLAQQTEEPFAAFQSLSTPPAIVLKKRVPPGTEVKKSKVSKSIAPRSAPAGLKKHVKITLSKNTKHKQSDYQKQIKCSPAVPFDSNKKPTHSVLKRTTTTPSTKLTSKKRRSNAADFF